MKKFVNKIDKFNHLKGRIGLKMVKRKKVQQKRRLLFQTCANFY